MLKPKILIVEDNLDLQTLLRLLLTHHGFEVHTAADGVAGLQQFYLHQPDLVLLDLQLPNLDGWELLSIFDKVTDVPIVVVSAVSDKREIARGLEVADAYFVKPFSIYELLPRLQAVLAKRTDFSIHPSTTAWRSVPHAFPSTLSIPSMSAPLSFVGDQKTALDAHLQIDLSQRRIYAGGQLVRLTDMEFRLLECLVKQAGRILTYRQILASVWGWEEGKNHHYVHVHISRLRQKLEHDPKNPQYLLTEHGVGYWWRGGLMNANA